METQCRDVKTYKSNAGDRDMRCLEEIIGFFHGCWNNDECVYIFEKRQGRTSYIGEEQLTMSYLYVPIGCTFILWLNFLTYYLVGNIRVAIERISGIPSPK
ncbi:unnamed protein product [Allacma fusca]|uniref:Uncharacterized protein n=1 Tax=Allacma fusca TaxID=39272 RepID=A0A8J2LEH0_9HEXA|nr:unnamed protein product [Allacma fusca]